MLATLSGSSSLGTPIDACATHMLINICFSFVNLFLASLIYWVLAGERKMGRRKDFSSPTIGKKYANNNNF